MVLQIRGVISVACVFAILAVRPIQAQETAPKQAGDPAAPSQQAWAELQRELERLRAAGQAKEATELEKQAQLTLSRLLLQFRQERARMAQQQDPATHQIAAAKQLIRQVREEVGEDDSERLTKRLATIEQVLATGDLEESQDGEPEVHAVQIDAGTALPDEFANGRDQRKVSYAEVELEYSDHPLILVLSSGRPTLWNIKSGDARLHAVLRNNTSQEVIGVGDCPILLGSGNADTLWNATGRATTTYQSLTQYDGSPVTIGPSSRGWLASYLAPRVEAIQEDAKTALTRSRVASLSKLRFSAAHRYDTGESMSSGGEPSYGQFTIAGPIANSLVPLPPGLRTGIVPIPGDNPMRFALSTQSKLVMAAGDGTTFDPIPLSAALRSNGSFTCFCLDTKRNRLVLAPQIPGALCTYDIATGKWSLLAAMNTPIAAIAYQPQDDSLFGIARPMSYQPTQGLSPDLLRFTPEGAVASKTTLKFAPDSNDATPRVIRPLPYGDSGMQLALAEDKLALIFDGATQLATETPLKLIEPQAATVIYEGPIRVHHDEDPATVLTRSLTKPATQASGLLPRVDRLFGDAEQVRNRLNEQDAERAKQFEDRLSAVRTLMQHGAATRGEEQVYVVTQFATAPKQPVRIYFSDTAGPSTLLLSSSQRPNEDTSIEWHVTAEAAAQLKEVVLPNANDTVIGLPDGIKVVRIAPNQPRWLDSAIRFNLSLVVGTETSLTIGPDNGQWRAELAQVELKRLIANSGIDLESPRLAELEKHRFYAVQRGARNEPSYIAEFTVRGPVIGTEKAVTLNADDQILGVAADRIYVTEKGRGFDVNVVSIDAATGARESIAAPRLRGFPGRRAGAIDLRNQHLYLSTSDGINVLDLQTRRWSEIRVRRLGIDDSLVAYNPAMDMFYDMGGPNFGRGGVKRYNFRGALLDSLPLQVRTTHRSSRDFAQTVGFDHYLGEVQYFNGQASIQVTDLENGDAIYQGKLKRHLPRREIPLEELDAMYETLGTEHKEADRLMWEMSAGQNGTVAFLDQKLPAPLAVEVDIQPLVNKLGSSEFAEREAAFKKLREYGSEIEPAVRRALKSKLTAEAKDRLDRLIKAWESAEPQNGEERRHVSAIVVLERIGSSPAKALLRQIADDRGSPVAKRAAREALERMD